MKTNWHEIQEALKTHTNPGVYDVWLKHLSGSYANGVLTLQAPNGFVANWVATRLQNEVLDAAATVVGARPELRVKAVPAQKTTPKPVSLEKNEACVTPAEQAPLPLGPRGHCFSPRTWQFSFDDFVVGPCNELAYAAAKNICSQTLPADNVFISSKPGLGKTHLLQAVGAHLCQEAPGRKPRVAYLTGDEFARQMIFALKSGEIERFKSSLRDFVDLLLLEDVHFFQGKQRMQDELLATLKALQANGAKVVFSSSFLPRDIKELDSQLASRLCSGFLAVIDKPDAETRKRILQRKATLFQVQLPEDVATLLAERVSDDVRQLESCLQNLALKARLLNRGISLEMAWEILDNYATKEARCSVERIVEFICSSFELTRQQLKSKSRQRQVVLARNMAFYLTRQYTDLSLKDIGDRFNRKHSTVLKGIANVEQQMGLETPLGRQLARTMEMMQRFSSNGKFS